MNKAKQVAASKAGQKANELAHSDAVKGAAVGVACTVVPGAAVASAVSGQGPCANSGLMSSLVNGKLKQAGSMAASGMASNAASGVGLVGELLAELLPLATVAKLNQAEAVELSTMFGYTFEGLERFCRDWATRHGWETVCVTRGAEGCAHFGQAGRFAHQPRRRRT